VASEDRSMLSEWSPASSGCDGIVAYHSPGLKYTRMLSPSFRTPIIVAYGVWLNVLCNMRHGKPCALKILLEAWKALVADSVGQAQHEGVARCGWLL
jgi:hypothetical protein